MRRVVMVVRYLIALCLLLSFNATAKEWVTYCVDADEAVVVDRSRVFWSQLSHSRRTVTLVTSRRLRHLQATCEFGLEPICAVTVGGNPARNATGAAVTPYPTKPLSHAGFWRYDIAVTPHTSAHWCLNVFAVPR
jgi:hypothetical protein